MANSDYVIYRLGFKYNELKAAKATQQTLSIRRLLTEIRESMLVDAGFLGNFEQLKVEGAESEERLQTYDLIRDRMSVSLFANKKDPRSKHLLSSEVYEQIIQEIGKVIRATAEVPPEGD